MYTKAVPKIKYMGPPFNAIKNHRLTSSCSSLFEIVFMLHIRRFTCHLAFAWAKQTPPANKYSRRKSRTCTLYLTNLLISALNHYNMLNVDRRRKFPYWTTSHMENQFEQPLKSSLSLYQLSYLANHLSFPFASFQEKGHHTFSSHYSPWGLSII